MNKKYMEYVYIAIAAIIIYSKLQQPERSTWDYSMIAVGCILIGTSLYRLFIKK